MVRVKSFDFSAPRIMVGGRVTGEHSAAIHHVTSHDDFRLLQTTSFGTPVVVGKIRGLVQGRPLLPGKSLSFLFQADITCCVFESRYHSAWLLKKNKPSGKPWRKPQVFPSFLFHQDSAFKRHRFPALHDQRDFVNLLSSRISRRVFSI